MTGDAAPLIADCTFVDNVASLGAAFALTLTLTPTRIPSLTLTLSLSLSLSLSPPLNLPLGAAFAAEDGARPLFERCAFVNNSAGTLRVGG